VKHRKIALILAAALLLGLLNGCSLILARDYLVITPHLENRSAETEGNDLRAESFEELKSGILHLVEDGTEEGVIRLYNYSGDPEVDANNACEQVLNAEPLGSYAVEYIVPKGKDLLSYYEITVTITYRKTPEQIRAVKNVDSSAQYRELLSSTYLSYGSSLTALVQWYSEDQYDVGDILETEYYDNPIKILAFPTYTLKVYPEQKPENDTGWQKIIEVSFVYPYSPRELVSMSNDLKEKAVKLLSGAKTAEGNEELLILEHLVTDNVKYLPDPDAGADNTPGSINKDNSFNAYGALVEGSAASEGYALAFKALCDLQGISCKVVRGRLDGVAHYWNIAAAGGGWYHIDSSRDDFTASENFFLKTDAQMSDLGYKWTVAEYPAAVGPEIPVIASAEVTQEQK
jgi:hypothetical protein